MRVIKLRCKNILKSSLLIFFCLFNFSCNNLCDGFVEPDSNQVSSTAGRYITFTGNLHTEGALPQSITSEIQKLNSNSNTIEDSARSALPKIDDTNFLGSTPSLEYFASAVNKNDPNEEFSGDFNTTGKKGFFAITLEVGKTWIITAGIRTKTSPQTIVFSDKYETTLSIDNPVLNHTFNPVPVTEGEGIIQLNMYIPKDEATGAMPIKKMSLSCDSPNWPTGTNMGSGIADDDTAAPYAFISSVGVKCGAYVVTINFYDENDILKYTTVQAINVFAGLTTNTWCSNGSTNSPISDSDGKFTLTPTILNSFARTVFYVGETAVGSLKFDEAGNDIGTGSAYSPLASLSRAMEIIAETGNESSKQDYKIFVTGTIKGNQEILNTVNNKAKSITIEGFRGLSDGIPQDVLDGNADGSTLKINTTVPVTIKNLKITGGKATNGGGINIAKGSVTLGSGAFITQNNADISYAKGNGVYLAGETSLTMKAGAEISNNKNTNCFGGGIYTAKDSTFIMEGGTIKENSASMGGGIHYTGTVTIKGGLITKNTASTCGGGLYNSTNIPSAMSLTYVITTLTITGGTISENSAPTGGALHCCKPVISGSAYIPYGVDGVTGKGKNDVYFGTDDSVCGTKITVAGNLSRHSATDPIALSWGDSDWSRGHVAVEADGTKVTDLTSFKDLFTLTNDDWSLKFSRDDKKKLILDSPIYVAGNNYKVCTNPGSYTAETTGEKSAPFDTIGHACSLLSDSNWHYTILVDGELMGGQTLPASGIAAASITLKGARGNTSDKINGTNGTESGTSLTISLPETIPVYIENLTITGGNAVNGGGILIGDSAVVFLGNDLIVTGNKASAHGGGVYAPNGVNVEGNPDITGNTDSSDNPSNLYLPSGKKVNVTGALTNGSKKAQIGISTAAEPSLTNTFTLNYETYNSGVAPGTYFTGDKWTVTAGSDGEAVLAASGGNITIEPIYEDITVNVDKSSVLKSATEKKFTFSASGTDSEGNTNPITIGNGEGQLALTIESVTYHSEALPSSYYEVGTDYVIFKDSMPAGNYTINTRAVYQGSLSEARTYSASFEVKIKESNIENVSSASQAVSSIAALTDNATICVTGEMTKSDVTSIVNALKNLSNSKPDIEVSIDLGNVTGVTELPYWGESFYEMSNLVEITLPEGITEIPGSTFRDCTKLRVINLPMSLERIGEQFGYLCRQLETVTLGGRSSADNGTIKIENNVIYSSDGKELIVYCNKTDTSSFTVPSGVEKIVNCAFITTSLSNIILPDGLKVIDVYGIEDPNLTSIVLPASVTTIGYGAFNGCPLTTIKYKGSEEQKNLIEIEESYKETINNIHWVYDYTGD